MTQHSLNWATALCVTLICASLIAAGLLFAPGAAASEQVGFTQPVESGGGSGGSEYTEFEYGPDYTVPNNPFKIFYSNTEEKSTNTTANASQVEVDGEFTDVRTLEEIGAAGSAESDPEDAANASDWSFRTTSSQVTVTGLTLGEYRINQVLKTGESASRGDERDEKPPNIVTRTESIQAPESPHGTVEDSRVPERFKSSSDRKYDGVIADAYVGIFGINGGSKPKFGYGEYGPVEDTGSAQTDEEYLMGSNGDVLEYADFRLKTEALPNTQIEDPVAESGTAFSYEAAEGEYVEYDTQSQTGLLSRQNSGSGQNAGYQTNLDSQTQQATTYHIESYDVDRKSQLGSTTLGQRNGIGGRVYPYEETDKTDVTIQSQTNITAEVYEYEQTRVRDRIYDSRQRNVRGSKETSGIGTGSCSTGENETSCTTICSTRETETIRKTYTDEFSELGGDRTIQIREDVEFEISGIIFDRCTGYIGENTTGNVSTVVTDTISGTQRIEFHYDYWDHWSSRTNRDIGGWEVTDKQPERTDSVELEDSVRGTITDNNPIEIDQISIEVNDGRYHNIVSMTYPGRSNYPMAKDTFGDQYLWSMVQLGESTAVKSELYSYSRTKIGTAAYYTEDCRFGCYEDVEDDFVNQQEVYTYSKNTSLTLVKLNPGTSYNARITGWTGIPVSTSQSESGPQVTQTGLGSRQTERAEQDNVNIDTYRPVMHNEFVVKNAPSPATEVVSIHGDTRAITDDETRRVEYLRPNVQISSGVNPGEFEIEVTGKDGVPLSGRDLIVSSTSDGDQVTTNSSGQASVQLNEGANHVEVAVEGDTIETVLNDPSKDVFYESVTAEKTVSIEGIVGHLWDLLRAFLLTSPLVMLYLSWRDSKLGE